MKTHRSTPMKTHRNDRWNSVPRSVPNFVTASTDTVTKQWTTWMSAWNGGLGSVPGLFGALRSTLPALLLRGHGRLALRPALGAVVLLVLLLRVPSKCSYVVQGYTGSKYAQNAEQMTLKSFALRFGHTGMHGLNALIVGYEYICQPFKTFCKNIL